MMGSLFNGHSKHA